MAVKWVFASSMNFTANFLDGAGSANVTLDLHLAVGQLAPICLCTEDIRLRPVDAVNALGTLSCMIADSIALQSREGGVRAALLKVAAAP